MTSKLPCNSVTVIPLLATQSHLAEMGGCRNRIDKQMSSAWDLCGHRSKALLRHHPSRALSASLRPLPFPTLWILPTELRFPECQAKVALSFPLLRAHGICRVGGAEAAAAAAVAVSSVAVAAEGGGELGAAGKLVGSLRVSREGFKGEKVGKKRRRGWRRLLTCMS